MEKNKYIVDLEEFSRKFKQVIGESPGLPSIQNEEGIWVIDKKTLELRLNLVIEEFSEFAKALGSDMYSAYGRKLFAKSQEIHYDTEATREGGQPDLVMALDGLADTQVVLTGTILALGFQDIFDEAFQEVHDSNMSKASATKEVAELTMAAYEAKGTINYIEEQTDGSWLCFRKDDKKLLKSVNYKPANLKAILFKPSEDGVSVSNG